MPSRNFINLNPEKRKAILDAALDQFSKDSFKYMRVSEFIRQAHISRASFYIYFEDKRDLYQAVLRRMYEEAGAVYMSCLREEKGCFYEASRRAIQEFKAQEQWRDYVSVGREILEDRTCRRLAMEVGMEFHGTEHRRRFFTQCYGEMNRSRYPKLGEEYFAHAVDLAAGLLLRTLIVNALDSPDMEEEGRAVRCQLMIVERALQNISGSEGYEAESKEPLFIGTANISNQEGSKEA